MNYLPYDDWLDIAKELTAGQQVRVNHNTPDCNGESNSMIIERKHDGYLSAYCHRCGCRGFYNTGSAVKSTSIGVCTGEGAPSIDGNYTLPGDCETEVAKWHPRARIWINKASLTQEEVTKYGICYSPSRGRVMLPVVNDAGKLVSYQTRRIHPEDEKPKYLTYRNSLGVFVVNNYQFSRCLVLVEDILSAIRIGRQLPCIALLGVKLTEQHLSYIIEHKFNEFIIWLDDDNIQVKRAQLKLKSTLDKLGKSLIIHDIGVDPKHLTDTEITGVLTRI